MEKKTKDELTLKDYFRFIGKKIKLCGIIAAATVVVSATGLYVYNKGKNTYVSTVTLNWEGITKDQYPDGTSFNYLDITSLSNLESVKEAEESLAYIDLSSMYKKNNITISRNFVAVNSNNESTNYNVEFVISAKAKYFRSYEDGQLFFSTLIENSTYNIVKKHIENFEISNAFKRQNEESQYNVIFNNIYNQIASIQEHLDILKSIAPTNYVYDLSTGDKLSDVIIDYDLFLKNNQTSALENEYLSSYYVRNKDNYLEYYTNKKEELSAKIEKNNLYIEALKQQIADISASATGSTIVTDGLITEIAGYTKENVDYQYELDYVNEVLAKDPSTVFSKSYNDKVNDYMNKISVYTDEVNKVYQSLYSSNMRINYATNGIIEESGMGLAKIAIISIALAVVLDLVVMFFYAAMMDPQKRIEVLTSSKGSKEKVEETVNEETK